MMAFGENLTSDDLVRRTVVDRCKSSELIATFWAPKVTFGVIFDYPIHVALHQFARPFLAVLVQERLTSGAEDVD